MMKNIRTHPNVVSMLGCCTLNDPICLIVEHVAHGDLLQYLKHHREVMLQVHINFPFGKIRGGIFSVASIHGLTENQTCI